jgi:triosephosphate isomerase (TIM)
MKHNPIVAANWKMHKTSNESKIFYNDLKDSCKQINNVQIILSVPFTSLNSFNAEPPFSKAAQNCHWEDSGAFTGEISVQMIKELGTQYVIVGHSERRHIFGEKNSDINLKIISISKYGLKPILCVGETLSDRENNNTEHVLEHQLERALKNMKEIDDIIIAYEPVWAIGTGLTADENQIKLAHLKIKEILLGLYPKSQDIPVLYGGSVKSKNAKNLIKVPGVSGFLIGGASLDVNSFISIINNVSIF